jgi:FkbM family methyltransferase
MSAAQPGFLTRAARSLPLVGKAVVGLFRFTPLPAPARVVAADLRDGRRMHGRLDDHTQRKVLFGVYEGAETAVVSDRLRPGDTFVDVGAHIGWYTTLAARAVGPAGRVFAFEPFPRNHALLSANVASNGLDQVQITHAAVSDAPGSITVAVQGESDSGSVTAGPWGSTDSVEVPAVTLDGVVPADADVAFIKIDVEGFERHVLDGAPSTLQRTRAVLIELNRGALEIAGSSPEEIVALLRDAGFTDQRLVDHPGSADGPLPGFSNLLALRPDA